MIRSSVPRSQVRDLYSSFGSFFVCLMSALITVRVSFCHLGQHHVTRLTLKRSLVSSRSFCIACGSTGPSLTGRRRRLLLSKKNTEILPNGGKRRPCRDDGDGEFDGFFCVRLKGRPRL
jgi:hypothetical protein